MDDANQTDSTDATNWKSILKRIVKSLIILAVIVGIGYASLKAYREFDASELDWREIDWVWVAASMLLYFAGMTCAWFYWLNILRTLEQSPSVFKSFVAFFVGQLGKYVPGKAMVVVLRTSLIRGEKVDTSVAALSVFVETLTMMAVGGFVSAVILICVRFDQIGLVLLASGLMLGSGVPTLPPIFRKVVRILNVNKLSPKVDEAIDRLSWSLIAKGWLISLGTWFFFGLSLFAILKAIPGKQPELSDIPLVVGCVALATVAGFLSLIPGGLGVRELVLLPLLGPFGHVKALASSMVLRFGWLIAECLIAGVLQVAHRFSERTNEE